MMYKPENIRKYHLLFLQQFPRQQHMANLTLNRAGLFTAECAGVVASHNCFSDSARIFKVVQMYTFC